MCASPEPAGSVRHRSCLYGYTCSSPSEYVFLRLGVRLSIYSWLVCMYDCVCVCGCVCDVCVFVESARVPVWLFVCVSEWPRALGAFYRFKEGFSGSISGLFLVYFRFISVLKLKSAFEAEIKCLRNSNSTIQVHNTLSTSTTQVQHSSTTTVQTTHSTRVQYSNSAVNTVQSTVTVTENKTLRHSLRRWNYVAEILFKQWVREEDRGSSLCSCV